MEHLLIAVVLAIASGDTRSRQPALESERTNEVQLYDRVVSALSQNYFDKDFRANVLPKLVSRFRPLAAEAKTVSQQRELAQQLLSYIPATHMGLLSQRSAERIFAELGGDTTPTFGFELAEIDGKQYVHGVLEGGPADKAGLRRGDRVLMIDGELVHRSKRLDWRTDDAFLPDPPMRVLTCETGDRLPLEIERTPGEYLKIRITAAPYSTWMAAQASARIHRRGGRSIGYLHFWMIHSTGVDALIRSAAAGEFADCDAIVIDLRGRGGNGGATRSIVEAMGSCGKPVVALIDRHTRSAKEIIAHELRERGVARLVGERTAGAVIPATFADVGYETVLMYPTFKLSEYTDALEGVGVPPDVFAPAPGPYSAGGDPILDAGLAEASRMSRNGRTESRAKAR